MNKAVFMDRDGTLNEMIINEDHGYLDSPFRADQFMLKNYAKEFIANAKEKGHHIIVVSNQPSIGRGTLKLKDLDEITAKMCSELTIPKNHVYYCPHTSEENCNCRKPRTGLLEKASADHDIALKYSMMIGDGWNDMVAGRRAGVKNTILIGRNDRTELINLLAEKNAMPDYFAKDLKEALKIFNKYCV